jgi:SRSO17 transposase
MDAEQIRRLEAELAGFLGRFDQCFARRDTRGHFPKYVRGQLSDLERKSVEPIALATDVPVRTLQEFLAQHRWDHLRLRDQVQQIVASESADAHAVGILDETGVVKKGDRTPGVQHQYCGAVGKQANCVVTVHLAYAAGDFHCLLDGELYLPQSWSDDRRRCRAAGIPDQIVYRPKWRIALELYDQAVVNGARFEWLTFDEGYGGKPPFLRELNSREQPFVAEIPVSTRGWLEVPDVTSRSYPSARGRPRRTPRLKSGSPRPQRVDRLLSSHPALRDQAWARYRVKDGTKGPHVWETKRAVLVVADDRGLPAEPYHLIVARNVLEPETLKFFLSNAPAETGVGVLLKVAFTRWRVERCFEDQKGEIGLDHYEGRTYLGLKRHLILSTVSYLFLSRVHQRLRGGKSGTHRLPGPHRRIGPRAQLVAQCRER